MKKRHIILTLLLPLLAACHDDLAPQSTDGGKASASCYVRLSVSARSGGGFRTISSPQPGEEGDDQQAGTEEENAVHDLNVFFFKGNTTNGMRQGINSTNASEIEVVPFYTDRLVKIGDRYVASAQEVEGLELNQTYDVLILANYGKEFSTSSGTFTLANLRDFTTPTAIRSEDGGTDNNAQCFLMASAQAGDHLTLNGKNDQFHPAEVQVNLERLAARVDYRVKAEYAVTGHEGDKVKLTAAVLANDYTAPEYIFKRVTESATTTGVNITYLGDETVDASTGKASNYVLDPKTLLTNGQAKTDKDFTNYLPTFQPETHRSWTNLIVADGEEETDETYHRLAYTHENVATVSTDVTTPPATATCVVFKATYTPKDIKEGDTFYWYNNKGYANIEAIKQDTNIGLGNANITESNLDDFGIHKYENGVCYYTYYICHADDGVPATESPMEHAIVRNNLYRLKVNSVSGPGGNGELAVIVTIAPWKESINVYPEF